MAEGEPITLSFLFLKQQLLDLGKNYVFLLLSDPQHKTSRDRNFIQSVFVFSESAVQLRCLLRITQVFIKITHCQSLPLN